MPHSYVSPVTCSADVNDTHHVFLPSRVVAKPHDFVILDFHVGAENAWIATTAKAIAILLGVRWPGIALDFRASAKTGFLILSEVQRKRKRRQAIAHQKNLAVNLVNSNFPASPTLYPQDALGLGRHPVRLSRCASKVISARGAGNVLRCG